MSLDSAAYFVGTPRGESRTADAETPVPHIAGEAVPSELYAISRAQNLPSYKILLGRLGDGQQEALGILFRRYARMVRAVVYRILHDASEADDLLQEVFLYLHRKANLFEARRGTARSWIVQVTYHRAIDRRRYLVSRHFYSTNEVENTAAGLDESRTEIAFYERSIEGTLGKELARKISEALTENQRKIIQRSEVKEQACRAWPDCARRCP